MTLPALEERLRLRLETLRANRERFIDDAQRQLVALDTAISELAALLNPTAQTGTGGDGDDETS